jgi:hypothetical protein
MNLLDEFYQKILKENKINCKKCNEPINDTTPIFKLQFECTTIAPNFKLIWLAEHKEHKADKATWTMERK